MSICKSFDCVTHVAQPSLPNAYFGHAAAHVANRELDPGFACSPTTIMQSLYSGLPVDMRSIALPLVLLLAYRAGAHSSLATWAAVSNLPAAPAPLDEQDAKRLKRKKFLRGLFVALGALALYIISGLDDIFFAVLVGAILVRTSVTAALAHCGGGVGRARVLMCPPCHPALRRPRPILALWHTPSLCPEQHGIMNLVDSSSASTALPALQRLKP